jgi:mycothiol synthase
VSFTQRPAGPADAQAIADLIADHDAAHQHVLDRLSEQDVLEWWKRIAEGDAIVVTDDGGRLVGVGTLRRRGENYFADNFTHPDFRGRGVGSFLLDWVERRAIGAGAAALRVAVAQPDAGAKELLDARGFGYIRSFYRMTIDLDAPPPPPSWPEGFAVATLQPGEERLVHETLEEAFEDHWDHQARSFEEWSGLVRLEPSLCYLVRDAEGIVVAAEFCNEERFGIGWVDVLGVRRAWRRHGLGEALLRLAFRELYDRGRRRIGLGVDAENQTGATRLYERVGMEPSSQDDIYEKLLQPAG